MQGVYSWGPYTCKLHDSIKSITEHKYKLCITDIQSDKVLKRKKIEFKHSPLTQNFHHKPKWCFDSSLYEICDQNKCQIMILSSPKKDSLFFPSKFGKDPEKSISKKSYPHISFYN